MKKQRSMPSFNARAARRDAVVRPPKAGSAAGLRDVHEYCDRGVSSSKAKRPGLESIMADARRDESPCSSSGIRPRRTKHQEVPSNCR